MKRAKRWFGWSRPEPQPVRRGNPTKKLTKEQKRQAAVIAAKTDADIDLSDAPEVVDWSGAEIGKFYRPPKKPVTMRLDIDIIKWLKSHGRGYQTRVNALLRHAMNSRWAARHEDEVLRQKAQAAHEGLRAKTHKRQPKTNTFWQIPRRNEGW
jgi:uncharacterized protein (DUF4415 family)